MKFRSFIRPLAVAAGLVLVLGLGLLGRLTLNTPLYLLDRGGQGQAVALQFVPKQSPAVVAVLARPDRLASLWEYLAAPRLRQAARRDQERLEQLLLANTGLSYSRDIQPWLGEEVTAAMVTPDLDQDPANGTTPGYLAALVCRDGDGAQAFLELYWQNRAIAGDALTFEDFSGSRLIYARPGAEAQSGAPQLATALVAQRYLLVANHPEVLRQALTAAQSSDLNLRADRRYKIALGELPNNRVGLLALSLPALHQWLHPDAPAPTFSTGNWGLTAWQVTRQGLLGHTALLPAAGQRLPVPPLAAEAVAAIAPYLPDSLAAVAVGADGDTLWRQLQPWLSLGAADPALAPPLTVLVDGALGPGAGDRLASGLRRGYGLGLNPASAPSAPDWLLVAPQSDALSDALGTVAALAQERGLGTGQIDVQGTPAIAWTRLSLSPTVPQRVEAEVAALRAEVDGHTLLSASPALLDAAVHSAAPTWWQQAAAWPGHSYLHLDWPRLQPALVAQLPQWRIWSAAAQPFLSHLQDLTVVSRNRSETLQTGNIVVNLRNR